MGRIYKPTRKASGPDGAQVVIEYDAFYIEYTDSCGRTRRRKAGLTAAAAKDALRQAESDVLAEKNGLPTRKAGEISCTDMLDKYIVSLRTRAVARHCTDTKAHAVEIFSLCRAATIKNLTPDAVEGALSQIAERGLSARTVNSYLEAVKSMLNWAVKSRLLPYNPLDCVAKRSEHEKSHVRRALTEDEISRLLAAALNGPTRRALKQYAGGSDTVRPSIPLARQADLAEEGRSIALAYQVMIETGLRKNEARLLTWADVNLDAGTLTTRPEWTGNKNGKRQTIPLAPALCEVLKAAKERTSAPAAGAVVKVTSRTLRNFDDDLVAAGIARRYPVNAKGERIPTNAEGTPAATPSKWIVDKRDSAGRVLDIHALRHTCGTRLVAAGVDIKTAQSIMRHATPSMTLGIYCHSDKLRMAEAVASLPNLTPTAPKAEAVAALKNGTDDRDETPDAGINPLHSRYAKADESRIDIAGNALCSFDIRHSNLEVGGSSPSGRIDFENG